MAMMNFHGTGMAMMETMVQTGLDGDHGTVMAMMDTMVQTGLDGDHGTVMAIYDGHHGSDEHHPCFTTKFSSLCVIVRSA